MDEEYQKHPEGNEKTDQYRANMKYLVRKRRRQKLQEKEFVHSAILHQVEQYLDRLGEFVCRFTLNKLTLNWHFIFR